MVRTPSRIVAVVAMILLVGCSGGSRRPAASHLDYPVAKKSEVQDDYHGIQIADPYRWLEDVDSAETHAWVTAQNALTEGYLSAINGRAAIRERLTELWDFERWGIPIEEGGRYFYTRNDGLQPQSVLFWTDSLTSAPRLLLDPNTLSEDGTVALNGWSVSRDGKHLAYALSSAGSDWQEWHVRDVDTAVDLADTVRWSKWSSAAWTLDGSGFYYSRYDEPAAGAELSDVNHHHKLYFHRLGGLQSDDVLIYSRPDHEEWGFGAEVSDDGRYLVIPVWVGTDRRTMLFYRDLDDPSGDVVELIDELEAAFTYIGNDGPVFFVLTDLDAPRGRVVAIDLRQPHRKAWREIVATGRETLTDVSLVNGLMVCEYLADATSRVRLFGSDGTPRGELELPGVGTASGFEGRRDQKGTFFSFEAFADPPTLYRVDLERHTTEVFRAPETRFAGAGLVTEQVFFTTSDGTRVPMFVTFRKGLVRNGSHPVLLYGYGGFNDLMTPFFSVTNAVWLEMGGVFAAVCLRGGAEYGEEWHQQGMLSNKQNVFDDFIAAAEWLIDNRFTSPERLAIHGASNGGLLVGAVLNQRPDLFGAALPAVGVMDMLRFHRFTIGWAWVSEFGSPDDPAMFPVIRAYSPLHNIRKDVAYPATLITTADHDDRVIPGHSFKYAAALQAAQSGSAPILIRVETRAGHGAGKPTSKRIEEAADRLTFLLAALDLSAPRW